MVSLAHSYVCDERRGFAQGLIDLGNNPRAKVALECVFSFHCAGLAWHNLFLLLSMFVCNGDVTFYVCLSLCVFGCVFVCVEERLAHLGSLREGGAGSAFCHAARSITKYSNSNIGN